MVATAGGNQAVSPRRYKLRDSPLKAKTRVRIPLILRKRPSGGRRRRGWSREDDAELHQPAGVIANEPLSIQPVEVLVSEVAVRLAVPKHVPGDDQDGVAHRRDPFLVAASACDAVILGSQIAVANPDGAPGALGQRGTQPAVAFARPARLAFPRALVVARADAGPGGGVGGCREAA